MNHERSTSADYVIYVSHTSSSAANPVQSLSAAPACLATVMKNNLLLTSLGAPEPQPLHEDEPVGS
jgi:hypothetical protein